MNAEQRRHVSARFVFYLNVFAVLFNGAGMFWAVLRGDWQAAEWSLFGAVFAAIIIWLSVAIDQFFKIRIAVYDQQIKNIQAMTKKLEEVHAISMGIEEADRMMH